MSGYYRFQKHQVNEQIQARYQEAETHRMAKEANGPSTLLSTLRLIIPALIGAAVVFFLLTGCAPDPETLAKDAVSTDGGGTVSMEDRIGFQDKLEAQYFVNIHSPEAGEFSTADRIHFQDKRDGLSVEPSNWGTGDEITMRERIEFHDRIVDQNR